MLIGTEPPIETAACQCVDCRFPTRANAPKRATHAIRHADFAEWLASPRKRAR